MTQMDYALGMDARDNIPEDAWLALTNDWHAPVAHGELKREAALTALEARVRHLLRHGYERLMASLYLLDVPERRVREALAGRDQREAARELAALILDREIEKAESRRRYQEKREGGPS